MLAWNAFWETEMRKNAIATLPKSLARFSEKGEKKKRGKC